MKQFNLKTGKIGEEIARNYLEKERYEILEQNHRTKYSEIDIIAKKGKELIFIEVRTKKGDLFGTPEDSLDKRKLRKLWLGARWYVTIKKWEGQYRIDAVCVVLKQDNTVERINHYKNIT